MNVSNQQLQAKIGHAGQNPWDRQVINEGFGIQQGFKYKLTFKAKAGKGAKIGPGQLDGLMPQPTMNGMVSMGHEGGFDSTKNRRSLSHLMQQKKAMRILEFHLTG